MLIKQVVSSTIVTFTFMCSCVLAESSDLTRAAGFVQSGNLNAAQAILEKQPASAPVLALWGKYYLAQGNISQAISALETSLRWEDSTTVAIDLGYAYWQKYQENQSLYQKGVGLLFPQELDLLTPQKWKHLAVETWQKSLADPHLSQSDRARSAIYLASADSSYLQLATLHAKSMVGNRVPYLIALYDLSGDRHYLEEALSLNPDPRSASWINYKLGNIDRALGLAESIPAPDLTWRYQWAAAKSLKGEDRLRLLKSALATANNFRRGRVLGSIVPVNSEIQSLYRDVAGELLERDLPEEALKAIAPLNISQLENFFKDNCFTQEPVLDSVTTDDIVIYTLVSADATYLVLKSSNKTESVRVAIDSKTLQAKVRNLRDKLQDVTTNEYVVPASDLYDILIKPIAPRLRKGQSLIFVSDSLLSNFPYAALIDRKSKQFLIEQHPVSYSAGLGQLRQNRNAGNSSLVVGVGDPPPPWSPLPFAAREAKSVSKVLETKASIDLKFKDFARDIQSSRVKVIHIASHARIAFDIEQSKIVFADREVKVSELIDALAKMNRPLDLLVLSGCQTAIGDDNSLLGLAGIAIKNNVSAVMATLWAINDADAATITTQFYQYQKLSKFSQPEQALQQAQVAAIKRGGIHPASWSAFIIAKN